MDIVKGIHKFLYSNFRYTEKLHKMLKDDGGIRALLEMVTSESNDVIAQVARGMANFAKCESRGIVQGIMFLLI